MEATLRDVKEYIADFVLNPQRAYSPKLFALNGKRIFKLVYTSNIHDSETIYQYIDKKRDPFDFQLQITDQFMDTYIFYKVDDDIYTKIIYGKYCRGSLCYKDHIIHSMIFPRAECDAVLRDTIDLQRIYDSLKEQEAKRMS